MNDDYKLTNFRKSRDRIVGRYKISELPSVHVPRSTEEDLVVRERVPIRTEIPFGK